MKCSGKMCFKVILKVTENQGFTLSLEDTFFEKPQGGQFDRRPPPPSSPSLPPKHIRVNVDKTAIIIFPPKDKDLAKKLNFTISGQQIHISKISEVSTIDAR